MRFEDPELQCSACGSIWPMRDGILDMMDDPAPVITPFQRLMQSRLIVSIYEGIWRQLGYYMASSRLFLREVETVLRLQRGNRSDRLLDLACGTGVFTRPLARQTNALVVGLDLSWPMLRQAQRLIRREGLSKVMLIRGTAFRLPFAAGSFDYVNCCGALHLFESPDTALDEIARTLKPGGHLCVQTTIRPDHSAGIAFVLERFIRFGFFELTDLQQRMCRRGFKVIESERHRISYTFLSRYLS